MNRPQVWTPLSQAAVLDLLVAIRDEFNVAIDDQLTAVVSSSAIA